MTNEHIANASRFEADNGRLHKLIRGQSAEIKRLKEMTTEWQPIETAPKDGTRIICAAIGHSDTWVRLESGGHSLQSNPTLRVWWVSSGSWSEKFNKFWDGVEPSGFASLSHWMPLPDPPENKP